MGSNVSLSSFAAGLAVSDGSGRLRAGPGLSDGSGLATAGSVPSGTSGSGTEGRNASAACACAAVPFAKMSTDSASSCAGATVPAAVSTASCAACGFSATFPIKSDIFARSAAPSVVSDNSGFWTAGPLSPASSVLRVTVSAICVTGET